MTDQTPSTPQKYDLHWPAAVVACVFMLALVIAYAVTPPDQKAEVIMGVATLWGTIQTFMPALRRLAGVTALLPLAFVLLATTTTGCGATQAYRDYSIAATIARVAVDGAEVAVSEAETACASDEACVHQAQAAKAAIDAAKVMALSLDEAVQAAQRTPGGEAVAVLNALGHSLASWVAAWNAIAAALVPLGITLPQLPAEVVALVSSVSSAFPTARRIAP